MDERLARVIQLLEFCSAPALVRDAGRRVLYRNRACVAAGDLGDRTGIPLDGGLVIETYRVSRERPAPADLEELVHEEKMFSLGRVVAGIAHELNNPINFIYGNVDFLGQYLEDLMSLVEVVDRAEGLPDELRERLDRRKREIEYEYLADDARRLLRSIQSGAQRTATIVRDLKNFSYGGRGELQEMDVVAGIETTLNLISPLHKGRIQIERHFAPDLPKLFCNAGRVNQVFMNILTNAVQAVEGEGTICVEADALAGGEQVRVSVSDDGVGIPPELVEKITDPFFTTKDVGEGTGLGLWISERIVRSHGGTLTCESTPGEGSTFIVILPKAPPGSAR